MSLRRRITEFIAQHTMLATTLFSGMLVVVIGVALYLRASPLLATRPIGSILGGAAWLPSSGQFGMKLFILGTCWVTALAILLAAPICYFAAIYLAEYAGPRTRAVIKPLVDLLAGIPSVVYGAWGLLVIVPFIANVLGPFAEQHCAHVPLLAAHYTTGYCVLAGGIVLACMISPVIIAIADEVLRAVPAAYREAAFALGATRMEVIQRVVIPKALPGLLAALVLGVSRALGETMAVMMVVGNMPFAPATIFDPAYPLPALIANNYGEVMSIPQYDAALLGAAFILLLVILGCNTFARLALIAAMRRTA